jgi:hypothetical protein
VNEQDLEVGLSMLLQDMEGEQGDSHEIYMRLRQVLDGMRAIGMPLPDDLLRLEQELAAEFQEATPPEPTAGPAPDTPAAGRAPQR